MRAAFELHELAVTMRRHALAREYPDESAEQIEVRLREWLLQPDSTAFGPSASLRTDRGRRSE